jgi:AcrR family transcriptional regulator
LADDTRSRLLEAAVDAIDAGGETAVSVETIAKAAGVSAPTIYNHFRNREALIAEAQAQRFDRQLGRDFDAISGLVATIETREQLVEISTFFLDFMLDPERSAMRMDRMSAIGSAIGRPELADLLAAKFVALCVRFAGVLQPLQEKGIVRADLDLVAFAAWFTGSVTGRLFIEFERTPIDTDAWNRIFRDAVLGAVLPPADD